MRRWYRHSATTLCESSTSNTKWEGSFRGARFRTKRETYGSLITGPSIKLRGWTRRPESWKIFRYPVRTYCEFIRRFQQPMGPCGFPSNSKTRLGDSIRRQNKSLNSNHPQSEPRTRYASIQKE